MTEIRVRRIDPDIELPRPARGGDAGADLRSTIDVIVPAGGGRALVPTGIAVEIPPGWAGLVLPRSGLALRNGVTCMNSPGLVDAGFRGELSVILVNTDPSEDFAVRRGDRIAQLIVVEVPTPQFVEVDELSMSERGVGGFGHTGTD